MELWKKSLLYVDSSLQDAIRSLDESGLQIALVVDQNGALLGSITDGDIRRGLLRGLTTSDSIESIIHRDPLIVPPQLGDDSVLQLMQANKLHQLPVVDKDRKVVGLHVLDELIAPKKRSNLMVIMAGGKGMRLRPHTENCPKPLLPVNGKPMLEHIIEQAKAEAFNRFVLSVHYLGEMIEDYFEDGKKWGVDIQYLWEDEPLGTAGSISLLENRPQESFIVTNGDVLTDVRYGDLLDFHCRHDATATMAVRLHEWQNPYGVVKIKGVEIIGFDEKPIYRSHINAGVYALTPSVLDQLVEGERCDMPTLFSRAKDKGGKVIVYPMHEPWLDVGRPDDYRQANGSSGQELSHKV